MDRRRRDHGAAAPRARTLGRAVPPRVDPDRRGASDLLANFLDALRREAAAGWRDDPSDALRARRRRRVPQREERGAGVMRRSWTARPRRRRSAAFAGRAAHEGRDRRRDRRRGARDARSARQPFPHAPRPLRRHLRHRRRRRAARSTSRPPPRSSSPRAAVRGRQARQPRGLESRCGSADVLEALGVASTDAADGRGALHRRGRHRLPVRAALPRRHAPRRRPRARARRAHHLQPARPAHATRRGAERQLVGVYDRPLVPRIAAVLARLGAERAWVVHGDDGLDELTRVRPDAASPRLDDGAIATSSTSTRRTLGLAARADRGARGRRRGARTRDASRERPGAASAGAARDVVVLNAGGRARRGRASPDPARGRSRRPRERSTRGTARGQARPFAGTRRA